MLECNYVSIGLGRQEKRQVGWHIQGRHRNPRDPRLGASVSKTLGSYW